MEIGNPIVVNAHATHLADGPGISTLVRTQVTSVVFGNSSAVCGATSFRLAALRPLYGSAEIRAFAMRPLLLTDACISR